MEIANAIAQQPEWEKACGWQCTPIYSLDNAKVHASPEKPAGKAQLEKLGIDIESQWMHCPPRSPEFHNPIEHMFGRLKGAFQKWFHTHPAPRTVAEYMAEVEELFKLVSKPQEIAKDVAAMHGTYEKVMEAHGGRITKPDR